MPKIETIILRCPDKAAQLAFYTDVLGMSFGADGALRYSSAEAGLVFETGHYPYTPTAQDTYWKIALAVPNIELACAQLTERGVAVGAPRQFQDVGYLAHFQDPNGFAIELIEHWFKGNRSDIAVDPSRFGGGATLNLLTLRSHDIATVEPDILGWGMRPLSVQPVEDYGFTLHFYAFTEETPPNSADQTAIENREWVYQRPYTVLEIQEVHGGEPMIGVDASASGYVGTRVSGMAHANRLDSLRLFGETA